MVAAHFALKLNRMKFVLELFLPERKTKKKPSYCLCVVCQPRTALGGMFTTAFLVTKGRDCWKP